MGKNSLEDIWDKKKLGLTSVNWLEDISEKKKGYHEIIRLEDICMKWKKWVRIH